MFLICLYYCDARTISSEIAHSLLCLYSIFSSEYLIYGLHAFVCLVAHNLFQYCYMWIVVSSFRVWYSVFSCASSKFFHRPVIAATSWQILLEISARSWSFFSCLLLGETEQQFFSSEPSTAACLVWPNFRQLLLSHLSVWFSVPKIFAGCQSLVAV